MSGNEWKMDPMVKPWGLAGADVSNDGERMTDYILPPPPVASVPVLGGGLFPVRRIFCVGKNYARHVKEMGGDPKSAPPVFFTKPADAIVTEGRVPFPQATDNLHYEGELVVALKSGGRDIASRGEAGATIFGHAAGCDLTRRDHQARAKEAGSPWDTAKAFDHSAPLGEIAPLDAVSPDALGAARLVTKVNGDTRQDDLLSEMIWPVPEIIMALSGQFELKPGDLIFTGTPEGVGPLNPGDEVTVEIGALPVLSFSMA